MKIKEILELTQTQTISEIANNHLNIDEKLARQALKKAGCYTIVGRPGWFLDDTENPKNLEHSVYDFAEDVAQERNEELSAAVKALKTSAGVVQRERQSFDLDVRIVKQLKLHCIRTDQTLYEVVEEALLQYIESEKIND